MHVLRDINNRYWQQCTGFHRLVLVYTGFWPLPNNEQNPYLRFAKCIPFITVGGMISSICVALYDLQFKWHDYVLIAESLSYIITLSKSLLISLIGYLKMEDIVNIFDMLDTFTRNVIDAEEQVTFQKCVRKTRSFTIFNLLVWSCYSLVFTITPLFEAERRYPMHFQLPVVSPLFEVMYFGGILSGLVSALAVSNGFSLVVSAFMCYTGYLKILQHKLELGRDIVLKMMSEKTSPKESKSVQSIFGSANSQEIVPNSGMGSMICDFKNVSELGDSSPKVEEGRPGRGVQHVYSVSPMSGGNADVRVIDIGSSDEEVSEDGTSGTPEMMKTNMADKHDDLDIETGRHLVYCVKLHNQLIRFLDELLYRTNYMLALELIVGAVAVCLTMFLVTTVPFGSFEMFLWCVYLGLTLHELFGSCWISQELQEESVQVSDALYFSDWTETSPSYKRSMLIMMSRAVVPIEISTMAFLTFDMAMFTKVVNSGYSYYNVMSKMHKAK